MKYLKSYKIFEEKKLSVWEQNLLRYKPQWDIYDIYKDFLDEFGFKLWDYSHRESMREPALHSEELGLSLAIEDTWCYRVRCYRLRFTQSSGRKENLKKGFHKGFDGIDVDGFESKIQEYNNRCSEMLGAKDVIIGSGGVSTIDLDIIFFHDKAPDFSRNGDVEVYGSNIKIDLPELNLVAFTNSRHDNIIDIFKNDQNLNIVGLYGLYGSHYSGDGRQAYYRDKDFLLTQDKGEPVDGISKWVWDEWQTVCDKLRITNGQVMRDNEKISTAEFMTLLKDNQSNGNEVNTLYMGV